MQLDQVYRNLIIVVEKQQIFALRRQDRRVARRALPGPVPNENP